MALPRLPQEITILGEKFRIELVSELMSGGEKVSGETVGDYKRIRICASLDLARQWQVLLHEFVHGTLHIMGAGNYLNEDVEESIAQSLEYAIAQLLRQYGRELARVLTAEKEEK